MLPQARHGALLFGGMVFGVLGAAPSPAAAAQAATDEAVTEAAVIWASAAEAQPTWTLERLVSEVAARNPRIRSQSAAATAASYDVAAARWQFFPAPAIQAETSGKDRQLIASVTQPIYSFGRLETDLKAAKSRARLANVRVEEAQYVLSFRKYARWCTL
jgi:outer membrane protein TolC